MHPLQQTHFVSFAQAIHALQHDVLVQVRHAPSPGTGVQAPLLPLELLVADVLVVATVLVPDEEALETDVWAEVLVAPPEPAPPAPDAKEMVPLPPQPVPAAATPTASEHTNHPKGSFCMVSLQGAREGAPQPFSESQRTTRMSTAMTAERPMTMKTIPPRPAGCMGGVR